MSSCVAVNCTQGFVLSTDSIAFQQPQADAAEQFGRIRGTTRKLFQITDDVIAGAVGDFTSYLPVLNRAARMRVPTPKLVADLLDLCTTKAADSRVFVLSRVEGQVTLDACELGHV